MGTASVRVVPATATEEAKVLCALVASNECPGLVPLSELYVDQDGVKWDICKPCAQWEQEAIARRDRGRS